MLDPDSGRCQTDTDPRMSLEEAREIVGERYVPWPYMFPRADGSHLLPPEERNCPCCKIIGR